MQKTLKIVLFFFITSMLSGCFKPYIGKRSNTNFAPPKQVKTVVPRKDNGAIYQAGMRVGLFDDMTARHIGDILLIELVENTNASSTSNTNSSKDSKVDLQSPTLAGNKVTSKGVEILKNEITGEREFNGQGTSAMSSSFNGKISVTVSEILPNRNMIVRGEKLMLLNQSDEYIRFVGIVRPQDIEPDNTIKSTRVSNVHVAYGGQGSLATANTIGPLSKFFQSQSWPY